MLPGQLTIGHVRAADARGQKTLSYKRIVYTIEELYGLAGVKRIKRKPPENRQLVGRSDKDSTRKSGREYDQSDKVEGSHSRENPESADGEGTSA